MAETIRLLLRNAFRHSDPELTDTLVDLYKQCPTLLDGILARTDKVELDDTEYDAISNESGDADHLNARVINQITARQELIGMVHPINCGNCMPTRGNTNFDVTFHDKLREVYINEYHKAPLTIFDNKPVQYARKFGFTNK